MGSVALLASGRRVVLRRAGLRDRGGGTPALERELSDAGFTALRDRAGGSQARGWHPGERARRRQEAQKRGAVHFHYALGVESALELRAAKAFRRHLERLSKLHRYGFGHVNGKFVRPRPAREAAAYLSSYFLGGRGSKAKLTEAVHNRELPRLPLYVSRRLTTLTRTTMRNKRRQRHAWVSGARGRTLPA